MIHFVLNNLCRPASEVFCMRFHLKCLKLHFNCFISLTLTGATEKRQAAFLGIVRSVLLDDFGVEHHRVCRSSSALIKKGNDALATCKSSFVAISDFPARKMGSCINSLIIVFTSYNSCPFSRTTNPLSFESYHFISLMFLAAFPFGLSSYSKATIIPSLTGKLQLDT